MSFLNIPSIMFSGFVVQAVMSFLFWRNWRTEPQRQEFLVWSASCGSAAIGLLLMAFYAGSYSLGSVTIGPGLVLMGLALAWQGLRRFDHRSVDLNLASAGPLLWMALTTIVPIFQEDIAARLALSGVLTAAYAGLVVYEHRLSVREEHLPARRMIMMWFAAHGAVALLAVPAALIWPVAGEGNPTLSQPIWYGLFAVELLLHGVIAGIAAYLLIKERLQLESRWAASTDTLTGLVNRGTFLEMLQTLSVKVRGEGAFLYVDVDHVKRINDRFGHSGGDHVLKTCADLIARELPQHALLGRLAGAEFAAYIPFCDLEKAEALGHVICESVAQQIFTLGDALVSVTVSVGVAHGAMQVTPDELLKRADAALHSAKVNGRNAVVVWHEGDRPSYA
ncbi:GGDEF domain-containing protein [Rhizobium wuzhouense]|nr:GGDEF domain-containing protein [Rhizobium wuzhouense]